MFNFTYRKKSSLPNALCKLQLLKKQYSKYRFFFRNVKSIKGIITQIDYLRYPQRQRASDYCSQNPLYIFSYELMIEVCRIICYNFLLLTNTRNGDEVLAWNFLSLFQLPFWEVQPATTSSNGQTVTTKATTSLVGALPL